MTRFYRNLGTIRATVFNVGKIDLGLASIVKIIVAVHPVDEVTKFN